MILLGFTRSIKSKLTNFRKHIKCIYVYPTNEKSASRVPPPLPRRSRGARRSPARPMLRCSAALTQPETKAERKITRFSFSSASSRLQYLRVRLPSWIICLFGYMLEKANSVLCWCGCICNCILEFPCFVFGILSLKEYAN